jgi:hypothetical protein
MLDRRIGGDVASFMVALGPCAGVVEQGQNSGVRQWEREPDSIGAVFEAQPARGSNDFVKDLLLAGRDSDDAQQIFLPVFHNAPRDDLRTQRVCQSASFVNAPGAELITILEI